MLRRVIEKVIDSNIDNLLKARQGKAYSQKVIGVIDFQKCCKWEKI